MNRVLILGDSHSRCFKYLNINKSIKYVTGASCQGLTNWNSKLGARQTFIQTLFNEYKQHDKIFLFFGEVDCNATIWHYKDKYNTGLLKQLNRSIDNYRTFITEIIFTFFDPANVFVLAPILPAAETQKTGVRKNIFVSKKSRTKLTKIFCNRLEKVCKETNINYRTINHMLEGDNGMIKSSIPALKQNDHHISHRYHCSLWETSLAL